MLGRLIHHDRLTINRQDHRRVVALPLDAPAVVSVTVTLAVLVAPGTVCVPDAYRTRTICVSYAYHMRIK